MAASRKTPLRVVKAADLVYQLRIELLGVKPKIWRQLLVPATMKLHRLHVALLWTMGWAGGHLHEFIIGHDHYGEPDPHYDSSPRLQVDNRVTLAGALGTGKSFLYLYDYGDGWEHRVTVENILPSDLNVKLPLCLAGANACPPEDVGGPPGYAEFLEAIRDPAHHDHAEMLEWCGGEFDPTAFHLDQVNASLRQFKP